MSKINTTGDLREFLCSMINGVANGTVDPEKARNVVKIASQINESFYSEVKVARLNMDLKKEVTEFGSLNISKN